MRHELEQQIIRLKESYYNLELEVPDMEYDALVERYHALLLEEVGHLNHSVARAVGAPVRSARDIKVKHPIPMGSLDKVTNAKDLDRFKSKQVNQHYYIMPKYNGISIQVECHNGEFIRAVTRGDGYEGIDITSKVKPMTYTIPPNFTGCLRGEIFITNTSWETFPNKEAYKNQLNATIGICNADFNPLNVTMYEALSIVFYNMFELDGTPYPTEDIMSNLVGYSDLIAYTKTADELVYEELEKYYTAFALLAPVDGLVIVTSDGHIEYDEKLYPTNSVAVKFVGQTLEFEVDYVEWTISRRGKFSPVAVFKNPQTLSGVTVSRATAFNAEYVITEKIGPGALVQVVRSGEIIPYILKVNRPSENQQLTPEICPHCTALLEKVGVDVVCGHEEKCDGQRFYQLVYFIKTLNFKHFSEAAIRTIFNLGYRTPESLTGITEELLLEQPGWGLIKARAFMHELRSKLTNIDTVDFLSALGIYGFSGEMWKVLLAAVGHEQVFKLFEETDIMPLMESWGPIAGIGEGRKVLLMLGITKPILLTYRAYKGALTIPKQIHLRSEVLKGKKIAFTGKIEGCTRYDLELSAKEHGAGIGGKFDILVTDVSNNSSKRRDAEKRGAKIISSNEYFELIGK